MYYNSYTKVYIGEFDSLIRDGSQSSYRFEIYLKDKAGVTPPSLQSMLCSAEPAIHRYLDDDPIAAIKGSELEITYINYNTYSNSKSQIPLKSFYSEEDDDWKIIMYHIESGVETVIFTGYLVQEDCSEVMIDIAHEVSLVFTDGLGILKNIKLNDAIKVVPTNKYNWVNCNGVLSYYSGVYSLSYIYVPGEDVGIRKETLSDGDTIIIRNTNYNNGVFTIKTATLISSNPNLDGSTTYFYTITLQNELPLGSPISCAFTFVTSHSISDLQKIGTYFKICLLNTSLNIYSNVQDTLSWKSPSTGLFESNVANNIYINPSAFINNEDYDDLYTVLEKILYRFNWSLFQCKGYWKLLRVFRYTYQKYAYINGFTYDGYFNTVGGTSQINNQNILENGKIEVNALSTIVRPYKYIEHIFDYDQPKNLIYNSDLTVLGDLVNEYTVIEDGDTFTIKEYLAPGFTYRPIYTDPSVRIRLKFDINGEEVDRYLKVGKVTGPGRADSVVSNGFYCNKGDRITVSYDLNVDTDLAGVFITIPIWVGFYDLSSDAINTNPNSIVGRYIYNDEEYLFWDGTYLKPYGVVLSESNTKTTIDIEIEIPKNGMIFLFFGGPGTSTTEFNENQYRSISIRYTPYNIGDINISGHKHTAYLPFNIKNVESQNVYIDPNNKLYSKGNIFLSSYTGIFRDIPQIWRDGVNITNHNLGEIIVKERNLYRDRVRNNMEFNLWPIYNTTYGLYGMDSIMEYNGDARFYVFGKAEFNLKSNTINGTLYEIREQEELDNWETGVDRNENIKYKFEYIYK
jgi:hypothetical protein